VLFEAYGGEAMRSQVSFFEWHKQFKEDWKNMEDNERSYCPRSHWIIEDVKKVQNMVYSDSQPSLLYGNTEAVVKICV